VKAQPKHGSSERCVRLLPTLNLQAQIHLLANTLSLVGALLRRRPEAAEDLLANVTLYLRNQFGPTRPLVSLAEELQLVLSYLAVERARLGGRLRLEVACTRDALAVLVPSLVLQPLVENAVRHGIALRATGGRVRISARVTGAFLNLSVGDDGPGLRRPSATGDRQVRGPSATSRQDGWGLVGARLRLAALWGSAARLRVLSRPGEGTLAAISLPAVFSPLRTDRTRG